MNRTPNNGAPQTVSIDPHKLREQLPKLEDGRYYELARNFRVLFVVAAGGVQAACHIYLRQAWTPGICVGLGADRVAAFSDALERLDEIVRGANGDRQALEVMALVSSEEAFVECATCGLIDEAVTSPDGEPLEDCSTCLRETGQAEKFAWAHSVAVLG